MGGIEESPTVAAVQDGHFAEPPRHDRIFTHRGNRCENPFWRMIQTRSEMQANNRDF